MKTKKIIVPIDFSDLSYQALEYAIMLALQINAEIHIVHVYEEWEYRQLPRLERLEQVNLLDVVDHQLKELVAKHSSPDLHLIQHLISDTPVWKLSQEKWINPDDLIIMGSHGAKGINELFVGSNAQKIAQIANCPVLVIKHKVKKAAIANVVFASDFSDHGTYGAYKKVQDLFWLLGAKVHLLRNNTLGSFEYSRTSQNKMEEFAKEHNLEDYSINIYNDESVESGIMNFAKDVDADMIVLATHGRKGLTHLMLGSIAESLINHSYRPVLAVNVHE